MDLHHVSAPDNLQNSADPYCFGFVGCDEEPLFYCCQQKVITGRSTNKTTFAMALLSVRNCLQTGRDPKAERA